MLPKYLRPFHVDKSNLIRIGPKTDGGYIVDKRILRKNNILVTCGLNDDWEFEKAFQKINDKIKVLAFDHTVNKVFWNKRFKKDIVSLISLKKIKPNQIADVFKYLSYLKFFKDKNKHYVKKIVSYKKSSGQITINNALKNLEKILLKVDIEGDEYKILDQINKNSKKINLLIIEFHDVSKNMRQIKNFVLKSNFKIIHIHANNYAGFDKKGIPLVLEITFLNKKRFKISKKKSKNRYPIKGLDFGNLKRRDDINLTFNE